VADAEARGVRGSFPSGGTRSGLPGWSCSACSSPAPCGRCQREKGWSGAWPAGASRRDRGRHLRPLLGGNHRASGRSGHSQRVDAYRPGLPRPSTAYGTRPLALVASPVGPLRAHATYHTRRGRTGHVARPGGRRAHRDDTCRARLRRRRDRGLPRQRSPERGELLIGNRRATSGVQPCVLSRSPHRTSGWSKKRSPRTSTRCYSISKTPSPRVTPSLTRQTHRRRAV
jgi:hypothetical protein